MSEKSGRSEEKTDIWGNKYTQHYDADGNKCGWSENKTDIWGNDYTQHYGEDNNKSGWSEDKTGILGNEYTQHHEEDGNKSGWSEEKTSLLGNEYAQHYDQDNSKHGWSEEKTSLFGNKYNQHYDTDLFDQRSNVDSKGTGIAESNKDVEENYNADLYENENIHFDYSSQRDTTKNLNKNLAAINANAVNVKRPAQLVTPISSLGRRFFEYGIIGAVIGIVLRGILTGVGHLDDWLFNYYNYMGLNGKDIDRSIHTLPYWVIIPVFLSLVASFYLVYRVIKK